MPPFKSLGSKKERDYRNLALFDWLAFSIFEALVSRKEGLHRAIEFISIRL